MNKRQTSVRKALAIAPRPNAPYKRQEYEDYDADGQPVGVSDLISDSGTPWQTTPDKLEALQKRWSAMTGAFVESFGRTPGSEDVGYWQAAAALVVEVLGQPGGAAPPFYSDADEPVQKAALWARDDDVLDDFRKFFKNAGHNLDEMAGQVVKPGEENWITMPGGRSRAEVESQIRKAADDIDSALDNLDETDFEVLNKSALKGAVAAALDGERVHVR